MHILLYPMISSFYLHCMAEVSNWRIEELQSIEGAAVQPVCNQLEVRNWFPLKQRGTPRMCSNDREQTGTFSNPQCFFSLLPMPVFQDILLFLSFSLINFAFTHMSLSESTCVPPNLCQFLIFTKKRYIAINWRTGAPEKRVESSQKRVRLLAKAHPLLQQRGLRAYCETKRIDITCYGALAPLSRRGRGKELVVKDHCEVEGIRYHQVIRKTLFLL